MPDMPLNMFQGSLFKKFGERAKRVKSLAEKNYHRHDWRFEPSSIYHGARRVCRTCGYVLYV